MTNRTHFRKAYKSDHLGVPDLEEFKEGGSNLIFTIKEVKYKLGEKVAGKKGDFNVAYFKENIKPLVLNAGNAKVLSKLSKSSFVEDWSNIKVQLTIDNNVRFGSDIVSGVRISKNPPKVTKYKLTPDCDKWNDAIEGAKNMTLEQMRKHFDITEENYNLLKKSGADNVA